MSSSRAKLAGTPGRTARFFRCLGHPTRVAIIQPLARGERHVAALSAATGVPQGRLSSHLARLRRMKLVAPQRFGRRTVYQLSGRQAAGAVRIAEDILRDRGKYIPMVRDIKPKAPQRRRLI